MQTLNHSQRINAFNSSPAISLKVSILRSCSSSFFRIVMGIWLWRWQRKANNIGYWFSHDAAYGTRKFWCVYRKIQYRFWELILNKFVDFFTLVNEWQWINLTECGKMWESYKVRGWKANKLKGNAYHYTVRDSVTSFIVYSEIDLKYPSRIPYEQGVWYYGNK